VGRRGWFFAAVAALTVTVLVLALVAVLGPAARPTLQVEPEVSFSLPGPARSCTGATYLPGGGARVPLKVSEAAGQVASTLRVCIGGHGPYPFVLDTGAGQSTIDAGLARRLHLGRAGPASEFAGVGCTGSAQPVSVHAWSLDGIALSPQQLTAATLPQMGRKGEPVGLLGSDVLSRFGAVRIDFAAGTLVVPGPEGTPLNASLPARGPDGSQPPASLTGGTGSTVPLTLNNAEGDVSLGVAVRFHGGARRDFVVDTGSSQSVVSSAVARTAALSPTDRAQRQSTVCNTIIVPLVHSGAWSMPGVALHPSLIGSADFGPALGGTEGLLGSDQLKRFGWVVLDYSGSTMVLGST
jgi:predicted aspartyl protease